MRRPEKGSARLGSGALPRRSEHQDSSGCRRPGPSGAFPADRGQRNDITQAPALLAGFKPQYVLAGKGYDSRELVALIQTQGAEAVIPPRSCQQPRPYDKPRSRLRNRIERCFARFKQYRRIATRLDRKPGHFLAFLYLPFRIFLLFRLL